MNLFEFASNSGDSTLVSLLFNGTEAEVMLDHSGLEKKVLIRIKTNLIYSSIRANETVRACFVSVSNLHDFLDSKNGVFVPSDSFGTFMDEVREGLHLAYGLRTSQYGYTFSLIGGFKFLAIIRSLSDVQLEFPSS